MAEKETLWASIEAMPEFQEKTPEEKLGYASYFLEKQAAKLAPDLADNPEGQAYFRDKSKSFLFGIADRHFPSGLEAAPSQIGESLAREDRALSLEGARMNTEIGKQAETTLAGLEGKPDDEILKGDPTTFQTLSPNQDTTVGEYKTYLKSVIDAQAVKGGKKASDIVESFDESAKRTPSAAMLKLQLSEGWAGWDELIAKSEDPIDTAIAAISGTMLESGVQSAKGAVAGAAATAATGNPLVGGAVMGGVAGESEYQATYLGELQSELQKRGKADAATIQEILKDDEFNARVDKKAMTRGVTIGATEAVAGALSFGIANKIGTTTAKKALLGVGAEAGIGAAGGSGGEFLARLFSGEDIWTPEARKDIVSEGVAEIGQAGTGTATVAFEQIANRRSQSPKSEQKPNLPSTDEEKNLQTPPQVDEPATPTPEDDDAPARSALEEFADEEDATEVPASDVPEVAPPVPPSPVIPEEEVAPVEEAAPAAQPLPDPVPDEEANTPDAETLDEPFVASEFEIDEGLVVRVLQEPDGTARVEKINTETGVTIPLEGAEAPFESRAAATEFLSKSFAQNQEGQIVSEAAAKNPGLLSRGEQDPLMIFLQAEKMQPKQTDIRTIGRIAQKERKGFRGLEEDTSSQASYEGAPLLLDYPNNPTAQERLRAIYSRESGNRPDQVAQMAFDNVDANGNPAPLISAPTAEALFQAIRERLDGDGGLVSKRRESDADIAQMAAERAQSVEENAAGFFAKIKSAYRRGGVQPARQFEIGDRMTVGTDTLEVTDKNDDTVTVRSEAHGIFELNPFETIGYDALEENGVPMTEREGLPAEDVVSREEAAALTDFLRERLKTRGKGASARVVPSREHSAVSKSREELDAARRLARLFGRRVVGVDGLPSNGAVSRADNRNIFLATDSDRVELQVVAHELMHQLRVSDDDLYQDLLSTLGVEFDEEGRVVAVGADLQGYLRDVRPENQSLSDDVLIEEFLADYLAERAGANEFWEGLALRDPSTFERFVAFVLDFLRQIADRIRNDKIKVERYLRDQAAMRTALEEVMVAFNARQSQADAGVLDTSLEESLPFSDQRNIDIEPANSHTAYFYGDGELVMAPAFWLRFGQLPDSGVSRSSVLDVSESGFLTNEEKGVSAFSARLINGRFVIATGQLNGSGMASLDELIASGRKAFIVGGEDTKDLGGDGEPLVRNASLLGEIERPIISDQSEEIGSDVSQLNSDDIRFADERATKPNQQVFGQKIGREDEMQGQEELQSAVRSLYFDGMAEITPESRDDAFWLLNEMRDSTFDAKAETGLDAANTVLGGELWVFANRLMEIGESTLYEQMKDRANDYNGREKTVAARILNAVGWYTREVDQAASEINKAKTEIVNTDTGDPNAAEILKEIQRENDALKLKVEQLEAQDKEKSAKLDAFIQGKAGTGSTANTETLTKQLTGGRKAGTKTRAAVQKFENFLKDTFGDIRFSDERLSEEDRNVMVARWVREQATAKHKKKAVFIRNLMEAGRTREFAEEMFLKAAEFRAEIAESLKADKTETQQAPVEKTPAEKAAETINAESVALDKLNRKASKLAERTEKGPQKRKPSEAPKDDWQKTVERLMGQGEAFNRAEAVKALLRDGLNTETASRLATAIEAKIKNELAKKSKASPAEQAREIIDRYKNPVESQNRAKSPTRILINKALKKGSTVTQADFMADAKKIGIPQKEAADLWADIVELRDIQQQIRNDQEAKRKERQEAKADQEQAKRLIEKLENPQDPASPRVKRVTERVYADLFKPDRPMRTREEFVAVLGKASVDPATASQLYDLALKEKARLEAEKKNATAKRFLTKSAINAIKREILAHPSLKIVGPAERLAIMARLIEERAGLTAPDALTAAKMFDEMIVKAWETAGLEIAENVATRRNAPYFRKDPTGKSNPNKKTSFDKLREAIRAGALDPTRRTLDEVAKANGWSDLTEGELAELARLDALLDDPDITDFEQIRYKRQMLAIYQNSALPPSIWKVISETYVANIFSGPSTMMLGLWALADSLMTVPRDFVVSAIGSANKGGKLADARNLTGFFTALSQSHRTFQAAFNDAIVTMRTGDMRNVMADELARSIGNLDKVWARLVPVLSNPNASTAKKSAAATGLFLTSARFALRVLSAMDSFTRGVNRRFQTELELFSKAGNLGWSKKRIKSLLASVAVEKNHFADLADQKGFKGSDKVAFVNDRLTNAIYAAFNGKGVLMDPETVPRATREANLPTGMGEIQIGTIMAAGKAAMAAKSFSSESGIFGKILVPVVQTPYNAFHRSVWYSPYAFVRLLGTAIHTRSGLVPFRNWEKTHYPEALADPVQLTLRATEAVLGNALLGTFAAVIVGQMLEDDEEKRWLWINLSGPSSATGSTLAERSAWLASGRRPFTLQFKDGDRRITVAFRRGGLEPFNFPFTLFGVLDQMKYEKGGYESVPDKYAAILAKETIGESMFFLRSFTSRGFAMDRGRLGSEIGYRLSGFVPWASMLKTPNRFEDMTQRPEGFLPNVAWQMPIVPQMNESEPALNALGQPVGFNETSPGYMLSRVGLPIGTVPNASRNKGSSNPTYRDVLMLLQDKDSFPSDTRKSDLDATAGRETTPAEFRAFQKARGEALLSFLRENYKELWTMEPEKFDEVLRDRSTKITKSVKKQMGLYAR